MQFTALDEANSRAASGVVVSRPSGSCGDSRWGVDPMWDGAPTEFDILEDFPVESLEKALMVFAEGRGSSIMTISCANLETYEQARVDTEKYDLSHSQMGAWTEFFLTMFPEHQAQHQRGPFAPPTTDVPARTTHA
jgi:hypothetical protein